jgi:hypothetical protein
MLFDLAVLDLPAVGIAGARSLDWSGPADDLWIVSHITRMTATLKDKNGPLASIFASALDICSAQLRHRLSGR